MLLTETDIKYLVKSTLKTLLESNTVEKFNARENGITFNDVANGVTLYHRPKDAMVTVGGERMSILDSIFKYGFSREFTSSNGGNMYGAGVYTVYNLRSSNEKATGYGSSIVKLKLIGGYKDFLIFSEQLAKETYGNRWHIKQQIVDIFPHDLAQRILNSVHLVMHDDNDSFRDMRKSSVCAHQIITLLNETNVNRTKCRGLVYNGGHDGACCFIRDFSSVVPVAYSTDNGKTWHNRLTQELIDRMNNEVDTHFQFGANKDFKEVADKAVNGYTMVWDKNDKVNYIPANRNDVISNVWFDDGEYWKRTSDGLLWTNVKYGGYTFKIAFEDNKYEVYDEEWEPLECTIEELPRLLSEN